MNPNGHPTPPGPPGPPTHTHDDGTRCMWTRRAGVDQWRQIDGSHRDRGPCPTHCPTCTGTTRETVNMVCQTCGTDYGPTP